MIDGTEFTVDREALKRALFHAREVDAHSNRAWDRTRPHVSQLAALRESFHEAANHWDAEEKRWCTAPVRNVAPSNPTLAGIEDQHAAIDEATGHLYRVGDNEAAEFAPLMRTQSGRFFARVEAMLQNICRDETGQFETPDQTEKRIAKEQKLKGQAAAICESLETQGVPAFRADAWQLKILGIHSHELTEIPGYRRICLNPFMAHRLRLPMLNWLQYFAQDHENALRFWTFTTGKRVPIHRLEARIEWLHKRLSQLNAQPFMVKSGVRIIFRSTEFGTLESATRKAKHKRQTAHADDEEIGGRIEGGKGGVWYHPHAHCVVWLKYGPLRPWRWEELLRRVWRFWRHNWDEGKQIRDMRECVKYVVKPGDMVNLAMDNPAELAKLFRVLYRKKLVQPMDELAAQMRAANVAGLRPMLRWVDDVQRWKLIRDANRNPLADGADKSGLYGQDGYTHGAEWKAQRFGDTTGRPAERTEMSRTKAERYFRLNHYGVKPANPEVCRVVARCAPGFNSQGVKEPRVVVMGTFFDKGAVLAHPLVRRMVNATRGAYEAGLRAQLAERGGALLGEAAAKAWADRSGIRVHTGTPTVEVPDPGPMLFEPDEAHDPALCADLAAAAAKN